jgi:hypothetical protein
MALVNQFIEIHSVEYGYTGMKVTIQKYLPELYKYDTSSEKILLANELIVQQGVVIPQTLAQQYSQQGTLAMKFSLSMTFRLDFFGSIQQHQLMGLLYFN